MEKAQRFINHNNDSPIVSAEWLDKNLKSVTGSVDTWVNHRIKLEDGTIYILSLEDMGKISGNGHEIKWVGFKDDK